MTYFEAYLITKLDLLKDVLFYGSSIGILMTIIVWLGIKLENKKAELKLRFKLLPIFWLISIMIPSSKEIAFIYVTPAIVNNKDLQEITKKTPDVLNLGLDYLKDTLEKE